MVNIFVIGNCCLSPQNPIEPCIARFKIDPNGQPCRNGILKTASGYVWHHAIPTLANRYQPSTHEQALLNPVGDTVVLPLPDSVGCLPVVIPPDGYPQWLDKATDAQHALQLFDNVAYAQMVQPRSAIG